jgi:molybdopterin-guanine dinucleotide biosynthesis protein A
MSVLYGLVVCGGESSRMGSDKSALEYYGQPQRNYLYHMLQPLCSKVFISCNQGQLAHIPYQYNPLPDAVKFERTGPMAALLTAFDLYPDASFFVVGCDYPHLKSSDLQHLLYHRKQYAEATAYYNIVSGFYEPLIGIYEASIKDRLIRNYEQGNHSLLHLLREAGAEQIYPLVPEAIKSIDTKEAYEHALSQIRSAGF